MKRIISVLERLVPLMMCILLSESTHEVISQESEPTMELEFLGKKISNSQFGYDIWMIPNTGGVYTRVTNLPDTDEYNPCWSPDGTKIGHDVLAFDNDSLISHDIYITDLATGISSFLCAGNDCSFSPDGSLIAISGIWIVPVDGGEKWFLTGTEDAGYPSWSPDGSMIVFSSGGDIFTVSSSGGIPIQLTFDPAVEHDPDWSPDGNWIAFGSDKSGNNDIWKIQVGQNGSPIGNSIQITTNPANDARPSWSPDGMRIAFMSNRGGFFHIWTIPHTGGTAQQITMALIDEFDPDWSPGGEFIVFAGPAQPIPVTITTDLLHHGTVGIPYREQLLANGGWPPYTWSLSSGSLPHGLDLEKDTGIIMGTPTSIETRMFSVKVTDSVLDTVVRDFSITVYAEMKCDVNGDRSVNVIDVLWVINIILEIIDPTPVQISAADCNSDDVINVLDAICIVNCILEIGSCPCGH